MKIAIDARLYGVENKGIGRYTQELVNNLQTQDKENNYFILLRKKYFNKLKLANNFRMIQTEYRHYSISEQIRLPLLLNKIKPDIFHALNTNVPLIYSGRLVVTVHDMTQLDFNRKATTLPIPFYAIKNLAYRDLFRSSVSKASAIIVPSEFVKADLLDLFGISVNKIVVIPEGVSSQFRKPSQAKRSIGDYLVYVGSSYPHKNLHLLIAAVNMLNKQKKKPIKLKLIVGNDYFSRRLASQVSKEQFSFVEFVSQVTDSNLRLIYRDSLAFVFPSLSEGFGLPGLEAMATGALVACSNIPTFKEVYGDNAIYFDPRSDQSLADTILKILKMSSAKRAKRIKKSQGYVKQFAWSKTARKTLEVYNSIQTL